MKVLLSLTYVLKSSEGQETRRSCTVACVTNRQTRSLESAFKKIQRAYRDPNVYDWTIVEPVSFEQKTLS